MLLAGLVVNAPVFGELSAPVDRYQGRIAWLGPLAAVIILVIRRTGHVRR